MITISLCMIIKDEEKQLARCLDSVRDVVDEIIVVDTGSSDASIEIAKHYSDKVFSYTWHDDFAAARNYSFSFASKDYCMWMDADDVLAPKDQEALKELKETLDPQVDIVMMKYNTAFDAQGHPTFSYYRERLVKRTQNFLWEGVIHEAITPSGNIIHTDIAITHKKEKAGDPERNLRIFEKLLTNGNTLSPREQFYYARELYYHKRYEEAIQQFTLFLNGKQGWVENCIDACALRSYCLQEIGKPEQALASLFESFAYDEPRAEVLCDIGAYFMREQRYSMAIYWYKLALTCQRRDENGAFIRVDCYDYIPYLQLCVCYDHLQEHELANAYNERAAICKPEDEIVKRNRSYFQELKRTQCTS